MSVPDSRPSVLILEDDPALTAALRDYFEEDGWRVETAATAGEARLKIAQSVFDLLLADYLLPDADGLSVFDEILVRSPLTKVMLMTGVRDMEVAAQAFKKGAGDLISKPFQIGELRKRVAALMEAKQRHVEAARPAETTSAVMPPEVMVGDSPHMRKIFRLIELVSPKKVTVLITGESGTGKELVARAIHRSSPRSGKPFVAIHCGAIPETLLEDELFGHVRGAYTGASQPRAGRFEQAEGGTLFLDEIATMPLSLQVKLLRVLETRELGRLGGTQSLHVDVRIVAASNSDLREKVRSGEFRADLFYRLNVVPIHLLPLRERKEDIPLLVNHFLRVMAADSGMPQRQIDPGALQALMDYPWPGNVRELRNSLEFGSVLSGDRAVLLRDDFPTIGDVSVPDAGQTPLLQRYLKLPEEGIDLHEVVSELEKSLIYQSLSRTGGNKEQAARLLSLKRTTLVEKLRRLKLLDDVY